MEGATTTLAFGGDWDLAARDATRHAIQRALARQPERLVLDLRQLTFIDSVGVQGTVELVRRAERLRIGLEIVSGPPRVQRVFDLCGLTDRLPFVGPPTPKPSREAGSAPPA
jgi:anti-sigma B factor antagonist